jgi:outer membrane protein OmpA-like peptidoglycan-associated protein/uncharacterized protein YegL
MMTMNNDGGGEPPARTDATPPPDYKPYFFRQTAPFSSSITNAQVQISRAEKIDKNTLRLFVHAFGDSSTYLTGIGKNIFCEPIAEFKGKKSTPKILSVKEVSEKERLPLSMALVLDHSGSMGEARARRIQEGAKTVVSAKRADDAFTLIKYDGTARVESSLNTSGEFVLSQFAMNGLQGYGGMTALLDASLLGIRQLQQGAANSIKAVLIFTDGIDNSSKVTSKQVIDEARRNNVMICAVDFGNGVREGFLRTLADSTGGIYSKIYSTNEIPLVLEDINRRLRSYYIVDVGIKQYGDYAIQLRLCADKLQATSQPIQFQNIPKPGEIAILDVYFDSDKDVLRRDSDEAIDNIVQLMNIYPALKIELHGHTDSQNRTKDEEYNIKLSQRRADAVKEALLKQGIAPERITTRGFGETKAIANNDTAEGRAKNRRTEFIFIE